MLCVLIRIASSQRFLWAHSIYRFCIDDQNYFPNLSQYASWSGAMIYPQWLELPMSRTKSFLISQKKYTVDFFCEISKKYIWTMLLTLKLPRKSASENVVCLCRLLKIILQTFQTYFCIQANSVDPDQTAPRGAVWSGSTLFAKMTFKITVCKNDF